MSITWNDIVFGPIISRRVGVSLGVNLLPNDGKVCSFDCIYCECGWNRDGRTSSKLPTVEDVSLDLETKFKTLIEQGINVDSISFTGNGEPTIHPDFERIVEATIALRDKYMPKAVISIFCNSTTLGKESVRRALGRVDNPILKLDTVDQSLFELINQPQSHLNVNQVVEWIKLFEGNCIIQTMFFKGEYEGVVFDNSDDSVVSEWLRTVIDIHPREVMLYTLDRESPAAGLQKVCVDRMNELANSLEDAGIKTQVKG